MNWRTVRLRHVALVNPLMPEFNLLAPDQAVTFLPLEAVWSGTELDTSRSRSKSEVGSGYTRFRTGDILIPKITPTFQADRSAIARDLIGGLGAGTTELHVVRPTSAIDTRFLRYSFSDRRFLAQGEAAMIGVAGQRRVPDEFVRDWLIHMPSVETQRAIADYLDAEVAYIDRLVRLRSRHLDLLEERDFAALSSLLLPDGVPRIRLGRVATVHSGLTVDAARDVGTDWVERPYLRVANVQADRLDLTTVTMIRVPRSIAIRSTLRDGDVLMTEGGDLDKLARGTVWRDEVPGALHQNHVFAVRPDPSQLSTEYLALMTRTHHARSYFEVTGKQTTNLASTSSSKIRDFPIPQIHLANKQAWCGWPRRSLSPPRASGQR